MSLSEFKTWGVTFDESLHSADKLSTFTAKPGLDVQYFRDMLEERTSDLSEARFCPGVGLKLEQAVRKAQRWFMANDVFGVHAKVCTVRHVSCNGLDTKGPEDYVLYLEITRGQEMFFVINGETSGHWWHHWKSIGSNTDFLTNVQAVQCWWLVLKNWASVTKEALEKTDGNRRELQPVLEFLDKFNKGEEE